MENKNIVRANLIPYPITITSSRGIRVEITNITARRWDGNKHVTEKIGGGNNLPEMRPGYDWLHINCLIIKNNSSIRINNMFIEFSGEFFNGSNRILGGGGQFKPNLDFNETSASANMDMRQTTSGSYISSPSPMTISVSWDGKSGNSSSSSSISDSFSYHISDFRNITQGTGGGTNSLPPPPEEPEQTTPPGSLEENWQVGTYVATADSSIKVTEVLPSYNYNDSNYDIKFKFSFTNPNLLPDPISSLRVYVRTKNFNLHPKNSWSDYTDQNGNMRPVDQRVEVYDQSGSTELRVSSYNVKKITEPGIYKFYTPLISCRDIVPGGPNDEYPVAYITITIEVEGSVGDLISDIIPYPISFQSRNRKLQLDVNGIYLRRLQNDSDNSGKVVSIGNGKPLPLLTKKYDYMHLNLSFIKSDSTLKINNGYLLLGVNYIASRERVLGGGGMFKPSFNPEETTYSSGQDFMSFIDSNIDNNQPVPLDLYFTWDGEKDGKPVTGYIRGRIDDLRKITPKGHYGTSNSLNSPGSITNIPPLPPMPPLNPAFIRYPIKGFCKYLEIDITCVYTRLQKDNYKPSTIGGGIYKPLPILGYNKDILSMEYTLFKHDPMVRIRTIEFIVDGPYLKGERKIILIPPMTTMDTIRRDTIDILQMRDLVDLPGEEVPLYITVIYTFDLYTPGSLIPLQATDSTNIVIKDISMLVEVQPQYPPSSPNLPKPPEESSPSSDYIVPKVRPTVITCSNIDDIGTPVTLHLPRVERLMANVTNLSWTTLDTKFMKTPLQNTTGTKYPEGTVVLSTDGNRHPSNTDSSKGGLLQGYNYYSGYKSTANNNSLPNNKLFMPVGQLFKGPFDVVNWSYIGTTFHVTMKVTGSITNTVDYAGVGKIARIFTTSDSSMCLYVDMRNNKITYDRGFNGGTTSYSVPLTDFVVDKWHTITVTIDRRKNLPIGANNYNSDHWKFYVNGVKILDRDTHFDSNEPPGTGQYRFFKVKPSNNVNIYFGASQGLSYPVDTGLQYYLSCFRTWDICLTEEEVYDLHKIDRALLL